MPWWIADVLLPLVVGAFVFASGLAGLAYRSWNRDPEGGSETRDLINRLTGLIAARPADRFDQFFLQHPESWPTNRFGKCSRT
jgi:hypothetical protein